MILKKLALVNFRNYSHQEFSLNGKFNFIYGDNGHGKTNILEAISFTTFGRSFLGSAEGDCIRFGEQEFFIESEFENDIGNRDFVGVNYSNVSRTKTVHWNKNRVSSFSGEIFGRFPIVFLTPQSLNITYGNPSERRKFFDILISQSSPLYLQYLKDLAKILRQKNALLKNYSLFRKYSFSELKDLMNSYNEKLADVSSKIIFKRLNFLDEYMKFFEKNYAMLLNREHFAYIGYRTDVPDIINEGLKPDADDIRKKTEEFIYGKFEEEVSRSMTLAGPHRDDYIFHIEKENAGREKFELKNFASQGEHKTFLIALKLSEYDYLSSKRGTSPVMLLDDILSELDINRVSKIISHLKDFGQIFLTTTDMEYSESMKKYYDESEIALFKIEHGRVN